MSTVACERYSVLIALTSLSINLTLETPYFNPGLIFPYEKITTLLLLWKRFDDVKVQASATDPFSEMNPISRQNSKVLWRNV